MGDAAPDWDHFAPFAYIARNPSDNWVLACHVCNSLKRGRFFKTIQDVRDAILPERIDKGYEEPLRVLERIGALPEQDPWPDRLRSVKGQIIHHARPSRPGYWATACGLEEGGARWRSQGRSTRFCTACIAQSTQPTNAKESTT